MTSLRGFVLICFLMVCSCSAPSAPTKQNQADMHYKLAVAHLQNNNPTYALKELLTAVKMEPKNSEIHVALAQAYQQKEAYQKAEQHYFRALELSPDNPRFQNNLGSLYLDMQQWDKAIEYFDKAAANLLFLNVHIAVTGKGYAYFKQEDYTEALKAFKEAARLAPQYAPAYFHQSQVYRNLGQSDLERGALEKTVEVAPQLLQARYRLAILMAEDNDLDEAKKELLTIINFAPASDWGIKAKKMLKELEDS